jgi:LPXTG-motif cell wall-anchored protein
MTVSGHTGGTPWAWWLTGGIALVLISGAAFLFLRARSARRWSAQAFGSDADPHESTP